MAKARLEENQEIVWSELPFVQESAKNNFNVKKQRVIRCFNRQKQEHYDINFADYVKDVIVPNMTK